MSNEHYAAVRAVYLAVLELPPEERSRFLEDTDPDVRVEVEQLLAREAAEFLERPVAAVGAHDVPASAPERVGPYRILRPLGEGGMGVVYEAERDFPKRRVALKVLRRALPSETELRLFEREAQTLALLQHPGIAGIYDAGAIEDGGARQPYIAMELIEGGRPLLRYAEEEGLERRERLGLLVEVARAVHYAHQRGVVHLDLKPDNVLVDAEGRPRVLDFGIARVEREGGDATGTLTESGAIVGTLAYMSPEQAAGKRALVDVRSDVYSLGVVAYELLTGARPLDLRELSLEQALRALRETPARAPSKLDADLRGDLDAILLKALEKDSEHRYGSAAELADDLERHLASRPIEARPPSLAYVASRFVRRRPGAVLAAGLVLFLGLFSFGSLAWGLQQSRLGTEKAIRSEQAAVSVTEFLQNILSGVTPALAKRYDTRLLRTILEESIRRLETELQDQPVSRARLLYTIARSLTSISEFELAEPLFEQALELQRASLGEHDEETLETMSAFALMLSDVGRLGRAALLLEDVYSQRSLQLGAEDEATRKAANNLGLVYVSQGRGEEAAPLLRAAVGTAALDEAPDKQTLDALSNQAFHAIRAGEYEEAAELYERVLGLDLERVGPLHPDTLSSINGLASALENAAKDLDDERMARALHLYELALTRRRQILGPSHSHTLSTENSLAKALVRVGQLLRAEDLYLHVLETLPEDNTNAPVVRLNYATTVLLPRGLEEEAFATLREGEALFDAMDAKPHFYGRYELQFGQVLRAADRLDEAEERLLRAYDHLVGTDGAEHTRARTCAAELVHLYRARGAEGEAATWEARAH